MSDLHERVSCAASAPTTRALGALGHIRIVLVETSLSANVGAVARAMKTMGLSRLELVRPQQPIDAPALARAAGADDLLAAARGHETLSDALAGCRLVIGSSARPRSVAWPELDAQRCGEMLVREAQEGDVALLLGRERAGLTNEELASCHYLTRIPANPDYSSLNIAAAAQVFSYEIRRSALAQAQAAKKGPIDQVQRGPEARLATADEMAGFYAHLEQTLIGIGFADPDQSAKLRRRLKRLFNRARPDLTELNILRGILSAAQGRKHPDRFRKT